MTDGRGGARAGRAAAARRGARQPGARLRSRRRGGARAAFARAAQRGQADCVHSRVVGNPMEPRACLAAYDAATRHVHLHVHHAGRRRHARPALGGARRAAGEDRVIAEEVGGGFGVRFNAYPEYCAALFAAKKLGRPVKWVGSALGGVPRRRAGARRRAQRRDRARRGRAASSPCASTTSPTSAPTSRSPARSSTPSASST